MTYRTSTCEEAAGQNCTQANIVEVDASSRSGIELGTLSHCEVPSNNVP